MLKTRVHRTGFKTSRINHGNELGRWRRATCRGSWIRHILGRKQSAGCRGCGGSGNDELVCREAWALIGLEHAVGKCVLLGHLEVGLHVSRIDILELRIRRRAIRNSLLA
jgi:hypothetical protein